MNYKKVTRITASFIIAAMLIALAPVLTLRADAFTDISSDAWYSDAVNYVVSNGLFNGVTTNEFQPNTAMNRAMFATVLGRYDGITASTSGVGVISKTDVNLRSEPNTSSAVVATLSKGTSVTILSKSGDWFRITAGSKTGYVRSDLMNAYATVFTDVPYDSYFGAYVQWAYKAGIVNGTGGTSYSPSDGVTREQLCTMLYKYVSYRGLELTQDVAEVTFPDNAKISSWATVAVSYMQKAGVISGRDTGLFDPQAVASRAEVASILMRFNSAIKTKETTPDDDSGNNDDSSSDEPADEAYNGYIPFGNVVSESASVDMSYFSDSLFIGHSIIVGLSQSYTNLIPNAGFFAINGGATIGILGATSLDYTGVTADENGALSVQSYNGSLQDALEGYNYSKVYIMLGINEMTNSKTFTSYLSQLITQVRAQLGDPKIYLISVTPLSRTYTAYSTYFKRSNILAYNNALMQLSIDKNVYYLDMFSALATTDGYIVSEYTRDGVHLTNAGYSVFLQYLRTHT